MRRGLFIYLGTLFVLGGAAYGLFSLSAVAKEEEYLNDIELVSNSKQKTYHKKEKLISVREAWNINKNNKPTSPIKGKKAINLIRDYTFRIVNGCSSGTMWILDYELPKGNSYPTKFFFGTNAHIAAFIKFNQSNPYKQVLPTRSKCSDSKALVVRETDLERGGDYIFSRDKWKKDDVGLARVLDPNNVEIWVKKKKEKEPSYLYFKTEDIKLAYVATDFAGFGRDKWGDVGYKSYKYIADFAVIEIDFKDPKVAEKLTRGFHNKYHYLKGTKRNEAINLFARPLMERKSSRKMYEESTDIFIAGYPVNGLKEISTGNYNLTKQQTSKLVFVASKSMIQGNDGEDVMGHGNIGTTNSLISEYEVQRFPRGVEMLLSHEPMIGGSSGSLTTDGERNAIGVKSRHGAGISAIDVFRSPEIKRNGKTIIPAYDLIEGIKNNPDSRSYKDSIVKYLLKDNRKTHLSQMRGWRAR